jgi:hypothetical protein
MASATLLYFSCYSDTLLYRISSSAQSLRPSQEKPGPFMTFVSKLLYSQTIVICADRQRGLWRVIVPSLQSEQAVAQQIISRIHNSIIAASQSSGSEIPSAKHPERSAYCSEMALEYIFKTVPIGRPFTQQRGKSAPASILSHFWYFLASQPYAVGS